MSDTATSGAQGAADGTGQGQAGTSQGGGQQTSDNGAGGQGQPANGNGQGPTQTPEQLQAAVREREAENARYRERIRQLEEADAKRQQDAMTDEQRKAAEVEALKADNARLLAEAQERTDREAIKEKAKTVGFKNPDLGASLVALSDVRGADGKLDPAAVEAKLRERLAADPYLGAGGTPGDGPGGREGNGDAAGGMNALIRGRR